MAAVVNRGILGIGQSNFAGAALSDNGGVAATFTDKYTGITDPLPPNSNGGGSMWPHLSQLGNERGVRYLIRNCAVGGASVAHFTGIAGATVTGSQTDPLFYHNMGTSGLSTAVGTALIEGQTGFDPLGFLASARSEKAKYPQVTGWTAIFANAESDGGMSAAQYQAHLVSIANYALASGCDSVLLGLSASGGNSQANMDKLEGARAAAVAQLQAAGKPVFDGPNLYKRFGMRPPLYPEKYALGTSVHLTKEGQRVNAELTDASLQAAGSALGMIL